MSVFLFIAGLALLIGGAEWLVRGASRLAAAVGLSPLVIGLTVVAFGTSAPELAISVGAGLAGNADIAVGNVIGSNIFNVLVVLGLSAAIAPLAVSRQLVRIDVPLMIAVSLLAWWLARDLQISTLDGILLFAILIVYLVFAIRLGKRDSGDDMQRDETPTSLPRDLALIVAGLALLVLGADWLVDGAIAIARQLGVSELVISLTIVAAGTSLPEVATSAVASLRGERDIAVGNVVGSNLFNLLAVLGLTAVVVPNGLNVAPAALAFDLPIMVAVAIVCLPVFFAGYRITRAEGWLFIGYYIAYAGYLILRATEHAALQYIEPMLLYVVIPATLLGIGMSVANHLKAKSP